MSLKKGDHDIDCKIDSFEAMKLESKFVKKAKRCFSKIESICSEKMDQMLSNPFLL